MDVNKRERERERLGVVNKRTKNCTLTCQTADLLTPWSRVLLEKLTSFRS
jgi:hypothetical protein